MGRPVPELIPQFEQPALVEQKRRQVIGTEGRPLKQPANLVNLGDDRSDRDRIGESVGVSLPVLDRSGERILKFGQSVLEDAHAPLLPMRHALLNALPKYPSMAVGARIPPIRFHAVVRLLRAPAAVCNSCVSVHGKGGNKRERRATAPSRKMPLNH